MTATEYISSIIVENVFDNTKYNLQPPFQHGDMFYSAIKNRILQVLDSLCVVTKSEIESTANTRTKKGRTSYRRITVGMSGIKLKMHCNSAVLIGTLASKPVCPLWLMLHWGKGWFKPMHIQSRRQKYELQLWSQQWLLSFLASYQSKESWWETFFA